MFGALFGETSVFIRKSSEMEKKHSGGKNVLGCPDEKKSSSRTRHQDDEFSRFSSNKAQRIKKREKSQTFHKVLRSDLPSAGVLGVRFVTFGRRGARRRGARRRASVSRGRRQPLSV